MAKKQEVSSLSSRIVEESDPQIAVPADFASMAEENDAARLREELAQKERELADLRTQLAQRDAASQPIADEGPGVYRVVVRHAPTKLKSLEIEAESGKDAWAKFIQKSAEANYNPKDPHQRALKTFEQYVAHGRVHGYDREIRKIASSPAA